MMAWLRLGAVHVGGLLAHHQLAQQNVVLANHGGHAQAGGDDLGEGVAVEHIALLVEALDGRQRLSAVAQVAIGVVLDEGHLVFVDQLGDAPAPLQGQGAAGGVLEGGDEVDQLGAVGADLLLQAFGDGAVLVGFHGGKAGAIGPKGLQGAQEGGVFHQHGVALVEQGLADQVQALLGAGHGQDVGRVGLDAVVAEELRRGLAQGRVALGLAILQEVDAVFRQRLLGKGGDALRLQGRGGGVAAGKGDDIGVAQQLEDVANGAAVDVFERFEICTFMARSSLKKQSCAKRIFRKKRRLPGAPRAAIGRRR